MNKNYIHNGKVLSLCSAHQPMEDVDPPETLDHVFQSAFNCPDCECIGDVENEPADADTDVDGADEAADLHRRIKALDIS